MMRRHDCQPQSGTALLGGKIWQKQFFFYFAIDAVPGIGNHDLQAVPALKQRRGDMNLAHMRILHGFSGIIDQVGQCSLDCLRIGHGQGQVAVQLFFPRVSRRAFR